MFGQRVRIKTAFVSNMRTKSCRDLVEKHKRLGVAKVENWLDGSKFVRDRRSMLWDIQGTTK